MVIQTTKHKCKAVKRMEGALGIAWVRKAQGADEVDKQVRLGQVRSGQITSGQVKSKRFVVRGQPEMGTQAHDDCKTRSHSQQG